MEMERLTLTTSIRLSVCWAGKATAGTIEYVRWDQGECLWSGRQTGPGPRPPASSAEV